MGEHLTLALNDEYAPAAAFLDTETVNPDPAHVTYTYNPTMDFPADGTTAGHAYWVYGVTLRESSGSDPLGTMDVRSQGFGVGDPVPGETQHGAGVLSGGKSRHPVHEPEPQLGLGAGRTGRRRARHHRDERGARDDRRGAREGGLRGETRGEHRRPAEGDARRLPRHAQNQDLQLPRLATRRHGRGPAGRAPGGLAEPARGSTDGSYPWPVPTLLDRALNMGEAKKFKSYQSAWR